MVLELFSVPNCILSKVFSVSILQISFNLYKKCGARELIIISLGKV